jgi:hypothetical protein
MAGDDGRQLRFEEMFYGRASPDAERGEMAQAMKVKGVDEEIALLRVRLLRHAAQRPDELDVLCRGINTLLRAIALRHKLSPDSDEELAGSIGNALRAIGRALGLEGCEEVEPSPKG